MQKVIIKSLAKINIGLYVGDLLENGRRLLNSIIYPIALSDEIILTKSNKYELTSNTYIKDNLIDKVITYFIKEYKISFNYKVELIKHIPIASGLGGGSSNASSLINFINKTYNLKLSNEKLIEIAKFFGTDTVFSLFNKPAYVSHDGTEITFLDKFYKGSLLLITSTNKTYTKDMFKSVSKKTKDISLSLYNKDPNKYLITSENSFLNVLLNDASFNNLYYKLLNISPNIKLTGSGRTLYLYKYSKKELEDIKDIIKDYKSIKLIKTSI